MPLSNAIILANPMASPINWTVQPILSYIKPVKPSTWHFQWLIGAKICTGAKHSWSAFFQIFQLLISDVFTETCHVEIRYFISSGKKLGKLGETIEMHPLKITSCSDHNTVFFPVHRSGWRYLRWNETLLADYITGWPGSPGKRVDCWINNDCLERCIKMYKAHYGYEINQG